MAEGFSAVHSGIHKHDESWCAVANDKKTEDHSYHSYSSRRKNFIVSQHYSNRSHNS